MPWRNLGSFAHIASVSLIGEPKAAWFFDSNKHRLDQVLMTPKGILIGAHNEESTPDYFEVVDPEIIVSDPGSGRCLHRIPGVNLVGVRDEVVFGCSLDRWTKVLHGFDISSGKKLWSYPVGGRKFFVGIDGVYTWTRHTARTDWPQREPYTFAKASQEKAESLPGEAWPLDGVPPLPVTSVHQSRDLLAIWMWDPSVTGGRSLRVFRQNEQRVVWQIDLTEARNTDFVLDEFGWALLDSDCLTMYSDTGLQLWSQDNVGRVWMSPEFIAVTGWEKNRILRCYERSSGQEVSVPEQTKHSCWDLLIAGRSFWSIVRRPNHPGHLVAWTTEGEILFDGVQPDLERLGMYGISKLLAFQGRLYSVSDLANVVCYEF